MDIEERTRRILALDDAYIEEMRPHRADFAAARDFAQAIFNDDGDQEGYDDAIALAMAVLRAADSIASSKRAEAVKAIWDEWKEEHGGGE